MTEGIFALVGVGLGAVLGFVGTAVAERWRHSYIRNDARTDRQAATLREALEAHTEFVHAWTPLANQIAKGMPVTMLDPAGSCWPPRANTSKDRRRDRAHPHRVHSGWTEPACCQRGHIRRKWQRQRRNDRCVD